jgi:hypothetical protein
MAVGSKPSAPILMPLMSDFASWNPRKVLLTPSGPTKSGFWRMTGVASRLPDESNRIGAPPCEE